MTKFVNRIAELSMIEETFGDLLDKERLVRTPIINFYGVEGIGKTRILNRIGELCDESQVPWIQANIGQGFADLFAKITVQFQKDPNPLLFTSEDTDDFSQSIKRTQSLLELGPLVMLLDAVDITNGKQLLQLEWLLSQLIVYNKLFVILASQRSISFEREKSIARKLTTYHLSPLDQGGCEEYLDSINFPFPPATREMIFEWTHGYPLAMEEMAQAIKDGVSPSTEQGQRKLITRIVDRVIIRGLLAKVKADEMAWFQKALSLLSVPRRFNLVIMQRLIEHFEPEMKLANSLAYIVLPKKIVQETGVMGWVLEKAGFAIDEPVRNILLCQLKISQRDRYYEINRFLAELNWLNASEAATGLDRIRYQREYLYHSANSADPHQLVSLLERAVTQIVEGAEKNPDQLIDFSEEFNQDEDLKEILGPHMVIVLGPIYRRLSQKMYADYLLEEDEDKRFHILRNFFDYTIHNPAEDNLSEVLRIYLLQLLERENPDRVLNLYEKLGSEMQLRDKLGSEYSALQALIQGHN